jgi:hypothetical protein
LTRSSKFWADAIEQKKSRRMVMTNITFIGHLLFLHLFPSLSGKKESDLIKIQKISPC